MPRFLVDTPPMTAIERHRVLRLATERFPEVGFELRYAVRDQRSGDVWVCRASSASHLWRWARDAHVDVIAVRQIDTEMAPPW